VTEILRQQFCVAGLHAGSIKINPTDAWKLQAVSNVALPERLILNRDDVQTVWLGDVSTLQERSSKNLRVGTLRDFLGE
jgi:hypothetical protein